MAFTAGKTWTAEVMTSTDLNTYVRDNIDFLKINTAYGAAAALTVSSGVITKTQAYHKVAGEGAAADDVDTISGGAEGDLLIIRPNGYALTLKNGTGNLDLEADVYLPADTDHALLIYGSDDKWHLLSAAYIKKTILANAFHCPAPGTDWTPTIKGVELGASLSAKKCWLPLNFLKIGDIVTTYNLVGDVTEADAATLDCKLVQVNKADPVTTTDITNGAITQVTADGVVDATANCDDTTVATDKQYLLEITGTTGSGDAIVVTGAEVTVIRLY